AAAVEFAVVAPLLFLLLLGMIEFGRGFMVSELLTNAARAGCRVGVLNGSSNDTITTSVTNALTSAGITGATTTVQVNGAVADANPACTGDAVTVLVEIPYSRVTWLPLNPFLGDKTLRATVVMRRE